MTAKTVCAVHKYTSILDNMASPVTLVSRKGRSKYVTPCERLEVRCGKRARACEWVGLLRFHSFETHRGYGCRHCSVIVYVCAPLFLRNSLCCVLISLQDGQRLGGASAVYALQNGGEGKVIGDNIISINQNLMCTTHTETKQ